MIFLDVAYPVAYPVAFKSSVFWDDGNVLKAGVWSHLTATLLDSNDNAPPVDESNDYHFYLDFVFLDSRGYKIRGDEPEVHLIQVTTLGTQEIIMKCRISGNYFLIIEVSRERVPGSPFPFSVTPGDFPMLILKFSRCPLAQIVLQVSPLFARSMRQL